MKKYVTAFAMLLCAACASTSAPQRLAYGRPSFVLPAAPSEHGVADRCTLSVDNDATCAPGDDNETFKTPERRQADKASTAVAEDSEF